MGNEVKVLGYKDTGLGIRTYYSAGTWYETSDMGCEIDGTHNYTESDFVLSLEKTDF